MEADEPGIAERTNRSQGRDKRSRSFGTKLTRAEEAELYRAAKNEGKYAAEWAREVHLREARRTKDDALFTELIAMRVLLNNVLRPVALGQKMTSDHFNEVLANVRSEKRKAAQEVMQQYTGIAQKEQ